MSLGYRPMNTAEQSRDIETLAPLQLDVTLRHARMPGDAASSPVRAAEADRGRGGDTAWMVRIEQALSVMGVE